MIHWLSFTVGVVPCLREQNKSQEGHNEREKNGEKSTIGMELAGVVIPGPEAEPPPEVGRSQQKGQGQGSEVGVGRLVEIFPECDAHPAQADEIACGEEKDK
jgi:hypothetical protein